MKKAIGDNMFAKQWGFERGLEIVKQAGFDGIELWLGDVPWFQLSTTDGEVRELRRKAETAGLVVSNVSTGLHWASPLSARDPTVRARATRIVEREIETAVLLGTDAILVVAGLVTEEVPYNEVYQRSVDALRPLGQTAARAGVRIGCENCNAEHRFLMSPREFGQFLDDVHSPAVGIHLRGFLGGVAGSLPAGLPLDRPRPVATSPRRVLLDLGEQCALPESLSGYESALAGLGGGASVTHADARAASGCALLIVPAALPLRAAAVRATLHRLRARAPRLVEAGLGFGSCSASSTQPGARAEGDTGAAAA